MDFDPHKDPRLIKEESSGTFVIPNNKDKVKYRGKYRCYASNKLGTAISEEAELIVPSKSLRINIPSHIILAANHEINSRIPDILVYRISLDLFQEICIFHMSP